MNNDKKLVIGIVGGFCVLILLIVVGAVFFTIGNDKGEPSSAPSPTVTVTASPSQSVLEESSPSPSEDSNISTTGPNMLLKTMLETTWDKVSSDSKDTLCLGWNVAPSKHDQFIHSFEQGMGTNVYNLIDMAPSEFEAYLSDFFDKKC